MYQQNPNYAQPGQPVGNPNINVFGQQQGFPYATVGYGAGAIPRPKITQPVTNEQSKMIFQQDDQLDMRISKIDSIKNSCTHKDPTTGEVALMSNADGSCTCRVCGETFNLKYNLKPEDIKPKVDEMIDILQTAKTLYLDAPEEFVREYYQIISLLKKIGVVYDKSSKNFGMYETYTGNAYSVNGAGYVGGTDPFAAVGSVINSNPVYYGSPYGGYPYGGYPQAQPYGYPQQQPMYGQPATPPTAQQPAPQAAPQQDAYRPQWMNPNGYVNPTTGGNIVPPAQGYQYQGNGYQPMGAAAPIDNPLAYGAAPAPAPTPAQSVAQQPAAQPAPAPAAQPAAAPQGEVTQTKVLQV